MKIGGLQKTTLIDYPGKVACTVFLSGCTFRCPFCYSKELVIPEEIQKHKEIKEKDFLSFLKEKQGFLDACVICGGEPTINPEIVEFIKKIKDLGFLVKLDTNGSNPEVLEKLINEKLIDYIAMDIKTRLDQEKYNLAAGVNFDIDKVKKSIDLIKNSGIDYEFRTTIVPGIHSREDIIALAKEIAPAKKYFLQSFKNEKGTIDPKLANIKPFTDEEVKGIIQEISSLFGICKMR